MADEQQEETEYYWDEASQTYYYWDEETQAYYPWVEETGAENENQEAAAPEVLEETVEPDAEGVRTPNASTATAANPLASSSEVVAPAVKEVVAYSEEKHAVEGSQEADSSAAISHPPAEARGLRRRLSFAQHGGLAGCIQIANAERLQRQDTSKLTDADIKLEQQKARIREMLLRTGLADEALLNRNARASGDSDGQSSDSGDRRSLAAIDFRLNSPARTGSGGDVLQRSGEDLQRGLSLMGPGTGASVARDIFVNRQQPKEREFRRRSTVRFGTSEFRDPVFQAKLEAMLGSSVKK